MSMQIEHAYRVGIDVGGTFTDLVALRSEGGVAATAKVLTTPDDPSLGALTGVDRLCESGFPLSQVQTVIHGTTLVSNALIERKGAVTGFVTTKGFRDVLQFVGRELRYDTYDPNIAYPKPLAPRSLSVEVVERVDGAGTVLTPLDDDSVRRAVASLVERGVEAIAVALVNSFLCPVHEQRIRELVHEIVGDGVPVSLSHEVFGQIREYERASATVMNAYVQPLIGQYLHRLEDGLRRRGFGGELYLMASAGGTITRETAERFPLQLVESGPAAGGIAAAFIARHSNRSSILSFDMGGTTAKAAIIQDGRPLISSNHEVMRVARFKKGSGLPVGISVMDLIEIGAGGGSIAWVDEMNLLRVGPESAGASPGPACYSRGGTLPTVTDAAVVLGLIDPLGFLGGEMPLDAEAARRAIDAEVGSKLGLDVEEAAAAIHHIVVESMAEAARVHAVEMNVDTRQHGVVAFGGNGPIHAYGVARRLHAPFILCPPNAGVLSALGLLVAPLAFEASQTRPQDVADLSVEQVRATIEPLLDDVRVPLNEAGVREIAYDLSAEMCYLGQGFEVTTPFALDDVTDGFHDVLKRRFDHAYFEKYGRRLDSLPARVVTWKVVGRGPSPAVDLTPAVPERGAATLVGARSVLFPSDLGGRVVANVYERDRLRPGDVAEGPAIIEERNSSVVVPPAARAVVAADWSIVVELASNGASPDEP